MRHPFDGIEWPGHVEAVTGETRRSALGKMVAAAAGAVGLGATASAQVATTNAIGEEGGPVATTLALGEEAAATTRAVNEEGGVRTGLTTEPFGEEAGRVTSQAVPGLEDGGKPGVVTDAVGENGGNPLTRALNENGGPTTKALREEGGVITQALNEAGGNRLVMVPPQGRELTPKQLESAWTKMASTESAKGVQGCAILYGAKQAIPFLKDNLKLQVPEVNEQRLSKLIEDLDHDAFQAREKAEAELASLGLAAIPALQKALKESKSLEVQMRIKRLLEKSKGAGQLAQLQRGLEVLVALRTAEARELVETLAKGSDKEWLPQQAREALKRMPK